MGRKCGTISGDVSTPNITKTIGLAVALSLCGESLAQSCPEGTGDWADTLDQPAEPPPPDPPPKKLKGRECGEGHKLIGKPAPKGNYQYCINKQTEEPRGPFIRWLENGMIYTGAQSGGTLDKPQLDGAHNLWGEDGQLIERSEYNAGRLTGTHSFWNQDGQQIERSQYNAGQLNGTRHLWNENGQLIEKTEYSAGRLTGVPLYWNRDGTQSLEKSMHGAALVQNCAAWAAIASRFPDLTDAQRITVRKGLADTTILSTSARSVQGFRGFNGKRATLTMDHRYNGQMLLAERKLGCRMYPQLCTRSGRFRSNREDWATAVINKEGLGGIWVSIPLAGAITINSYRAADNKNRIIRTNGPCEIGRLSDSLRVGPWLRVSRCHWREVEDNGERRTEKVCGSWGDDSKNCTDPSFYDVHTNIMKATYREEVEALVRGTGATLIDYSGANDPLAGGDPIEVPTAEVIDTLMAERVAHGSQSVLKTAKQKVKTIDACIAGFNRRAAGRPYAYTSRRKNSLDDWPDLRPGWTMLGWGECKAEVTAPLRSDFKNCKEFTSRLGAALTIPGMCISRILMSRMMLQPDPWRAEVIRVLVDRCEGGDEAMCTHIKAFGETLEHRLASNQDKYPVPDCTTPLAVEFRKGKTYMDSKELKRAKQCLIYKEPFTRVFDANAPRDPATIRASAMKRCKSRSLTADERIAGCLRVAELHDYPLYGMRSTRPAPELATACALNNSYACDRAIDWVKSDSSDRTRLEKKACELWKQWCPVSSPFANMSPCGACRAQSMNRCCMSRVGNKECTWGPKGAVAMQHFTPCQQKADRDCQSTCRTER